MAEITMKIIGTYQRNDMVKWSTLATKEKIRRPADHSNCATLHSTHPSCRIQFYYYYNVEACLELLLAYSWALLTGDTP
jgi:hypothetical protein